MPAQAVTRKKFVPYFLGIDLGTTYSAAAVSFDGRGEIAHLGSRSPTIPSVAFIREDGEIIVGEPAQRRALTEPGRAASEFKRRLGDPTPLLLAGTPFSPERLMARLLAIIVEHVAEERGSRPAMIAVTHPASYGPYKLDLLQQMVDQAEVGLVRFLPEPVAAALHYASQEKIEEGSILAIYDFGGGTFDAAVVRKTAAAFEMMGRPEGLERLGGIDFDEAVFDHVRNVIGPENIEGDRSPAARTAVARLRQDCREAKEALSSESEAIIPVALPGHQSQVRLTRAELEQVIRPNIRETILALERSVRSAGIGLEQVDRILLVGGTSRIPLVGQMLREATGRPVWRDAHPKHIIALGAAAFASGIESHPETEPGPIASSESALPTAEEVPRIRPETTAAFEQTDSAELPVRPAPAVKAPRPFVRPPGTPGAVTPGPKSSRRRKRLLAGAGLAVAAVVFTAFAFLQSGGDANASAEITRVAIADGAYEVSFRTSGFTAAEAGTRVHFYWNTIDESQAASSSTSGSWVAYWGASPVQVGAAPAGATELCIVVAESRGGILEGSGNCRALPR